MKRIIFIIPIIICLFVSSCAPMIFIAGAAAGVGGYKYYNGALTVIYQAPYEKTFDASVKAMEELGFTITSKEKVLTNSKITAVLADNTPVSLYPSPFSGSPIALRSVPLREICISSSLFPKAGINRSSTARSNTSPSAMKSPNKNRLKKSYAC